MEPATEPATMVTTMLKLQPSDSVIEDSDEKDYYWNIVLNIWKLPRYFKHFPGPNPISLERQKLQHIQVNDFLVALKTDGVRYLLLLTTKPSSTEPISLMIDRSLNMYEVEVWANEEYFYHESLLDGELVWNSNSEAHYIVFDVVNLKGTNCIDMNYRDRLQIVQSHVLSMNHIVEDDILEQIISEEDKFCARNNAYNLTIVPKTCVSKQSLGDIWRSRKKCSHRNDGVIFTLNNAPIHTGTSQYIYKWKPSHSIDIKFYFRNETWEMFANDNHSDDELNITHTIGCYKVCIDTGASKLLAHLQSKGACVVECLLTVASTEVCLVPERERSDKRTANTVKTMEATILNAKENISIDELVAVFE